ncbi:MAG: carboxypeptidase-like regulatory domain-containing protein [Bacteroidaceae bacterium]|nr:carboxypeptidase-like regulatory domain-containing protein [Bacteroidaceae bacterium]
MKTWYFAALFAAVVFLASSCKKDADVTMKQGAIYGTVTDFATGDPVYNANVQLRPSGETTLTGSDGTYEFPDIKDGDYTIVVSKAEYTDLIDDYVIKVKDGRRVRRDVQIEKIPTYIRFTDMQGRDITELDFGSNPSFDMLAFNIYNNGTVTINCKVEYSCNWIKSVSEVPSAIKPGQNVLVTIKIDRSKLQAGENVNYLYISSNNGSNVIKVRATHDGGNPPSVQIDPIKDITATSAIFTGYIVDDNTGTISDCGFCLSTTLQPSLNDYVVRLGKQSKRFTFNITNLQAGTTYYVRAYAISNLGTGYSSVLTFSTLDGLPICGETTITSLDPSTARGESSAYCTNGYKITERGLCWDANHTPTINDQSIECGFGDGEIRGYLSSLQPNTTYRVRSYAKSEFGVSYGKEMMFTSLSGLATVTTKRATILGDEIRTGGNVIDDAGTYVIDKGVCYGYSQNPNLSWSFEHTYDGDGIGSFVSSIPMPTTSGYVYIRAYATTKYGTSYGEQVSIYIP